MINTSGTAGVWTYKNWIRDKGTVTLWSGSWYMTDEHIVELAQPISEQPNGIVIVWSTWGGDVASSNYDFQSFFIPKGLVAAMNGKAHHFTLTGGTGSDMLLFGHIGVKNLFITDTKITGVSGNGSIGSYGSLNYNNNKYVLRYVMGV